MTSSAKPSEVSVKPGLLRFALLCLAIAAVAVLGQQMVVDATGSFVAALRR